MTFATPVLVGLDVHQARIDAQVSLGTGHFQIVGRYGASERPIPDAALRESKVRVQAALAAGRGVHIVGLVNVVLPDGASMTELDLAIALVCLEAIGLVQLPEGLYCRAELALDGTLRPVRGCFAALTVAKRLSMAVVSRHDRLEAEASGQPFMTHQCLADVASVFAPRKVEPFAVKQTSPEYTPEMFEKASKIGGGAGFGDAPEKVQAAALAGRSILLLGRRGSGMTILARYYHSFLTLNKDEAREVMQVHSSAGILDASAFKVPFRAPHHSVSEAGMVGGGGRAMPGEVSLAHNGVLLLDELPEFRAAVLASIREARERCYVAIAREGMLAGFPCRLRIVATASPCPRECRGACDCPGPSLERYRERLALVGELEVIRLP